MRISDWSSDVCSSDLIERHRIERQPVERRVALGDIDRAFTGFSIDGDRPAVGKHDIGVDRGGIGGGRRLPPPQAAHHHPRSEEHTSELQSLMRISYAVFCLKKKTTYN